jgi:hypothetical protein
MLCREDILTPDRVAAKGVAAGWGGNHMHAYYEDLSWFVRQRWTANTKLRSNE